MLTLATVHQFQIKDDVHESHQSDKSPCCIFILGGLSSSGSFALPDSFFRDTFVITAIESLQRVFNIGIIRFVERRKVNAVQPILAQILACKFNQSSRVRPLVQF